MVIVYVQVSGEYSRDSVFYVVDNLMSLSLRKGVRMEVKDLADI